MITKRIAAALTVVGALALAGCASTPTGNGNSGGKPDVVASTNVWGDVAKAIGGPDVSVSSIITNPDADPHEYEADGRVQLKISRADLVIQNGGGYDDFVTKMLQSTKSKAKVIDAVTTSGEKDDPVLGDLNEHIWYDFPAVKTIAARIAADLSSIDPGNKAGYRSREAALDDKLDALIAQEKRIASDSRGKGAAITEPVPLYLLEACGLVDKTPPAFSKAIEDDTDVPVSVLQQTLELFSSHEVAMLAYNEQTSGPQTEKVLAAAKAANIPVVPVTETLPGGKTYLSWMQANLDAIATAVGSTAGGTPGS